MNQQYSDADLAAVKNLEDGPLADFYIDTDILDPLVGEGYKIADRVHTMPQFYHNSMLTFPEFTRNYVKKMYDVEKQQQAAEQLEKDLREYLDWYPNAMRAVQNIDNMLAQEAADAQSDYSDIPEVTDPGGGGGPSDYTPESYDDSPTPDTPTYDDDNPSDDNNPSDDDNNNKNDDSSSTQKTIDDDNNNRDDDNNNRDDDNNNRDDDNNNRDDDNTRDDDSKHVVDDTNPDDNYYDDNNYDDNNYDDNIRRTDDNYYDDDNTRRTDDNYYDDNTRRTDDNYYDDNTRRTDDNYYDDNTRRWDDNYYDDNTRSLVDPTLAASNIVSPMNPTMSASNWPNSSSEGINGGKSGSSHSVDSSSSNSSRPTSSLLGVMEKGNSKVVPGITPGTGLTGQRSFATRALTGAGLLVGAAGLAGGIYLATKNGYYVFTPEDWEDTDEDVQNAILQNFREAGMSEADIGEFTNSTYRIKTGELNEHVKKVEKAFDINPEIVDEFVNMYHFSIFDENNSVDHYLLFLVMAIDGMNKSDSVNFYNILNPLFEDEDIDFIYSGIDLSEYLYDDDDDVEDVVEETEEYDYV